MRSHTDDRSAAAACFGALPIAAALTLAACSSTPATPGAAAPKGPSARVEVQQLESGFTIAEKGRIGAQVRADYDEAMRLLEQQQYEPGIALLLAVTQSAPELTAPHVNLGIAYGRSGDLDRAEASLKRALALAPRHPVAQNELGMLYRRKGQFAAARASYEQALAVAPDFHYARLNLAILCDVYLADPGCALENYAAYQQEMPDDRSAAMWLADLRARAKR